MRREREREEIRCNGSVTVPKEGGDQRAPAIIMIVIIIRKRDLQSIMIESKWTPDDDPNLNSYLFFAYKPKLFFHFSAEPRSQCS